MSDERTVRRELHSEAQRRGVGEPLEGTGLNECRVDFDNALCRGSVRRRNARGGGDVKRGRRTRCVYDGAPPAARVRPVEVRLRAAAHRRAAAWPYDPSRLDRGRVERSVARHREKTGRVFEVRELCAQLERVDLDVPQRSRRAEVDAEQVGHSVERTGSDCHQACRLRGVDEGDGAAPLERARFDLRDGALNVDSIRDAAARRVAVRCVCARRPEKKQSKKRNERRKEKNNHEMALTLACTCRARGSLVPMFRSGRLS